MKTAVERFWSKQKERVRGDLKPNALQNSTPPKVPTVKRVKWLPMIVGLFVFNWVIASILRGPPPTRVKLPYSSFVEQLSTGNIVSP